MSWTDDCPMLKKRYIAFLKTDKQYLVVYKDKNGEYLADFLSREPHKDIFLESLKKHDYCMAIFKRNNKTKIDYNNLKSLKNALILIDECEY